MTQASEFKSVLDAAEEAAGAGNLEAAERLLREALTLQEASLGPLHSDLANTLNNLAVVCERMEKYDEAERGYRRAHAIAVASLAPRHPFVATSLKNLVDFCVARGIPLWTPPTATAVTEAPAPAVAVPARTAVPFASEARAEAAASVAGVRTGRVAAFVALGVSSIMALLLLVSWSGSGESTGGPSEARPAAAASSGRAPVPPSTPPSRSASRDPRPAPAPRETSRPPDPVRAERVQPTGATGSPAAVIVLTGHVCSALDRRGSPDWECTPVNGVGQPGVLTFYTRLLSESATTVEHRWYYADRLHQTMRLNVPASEGGYRTYSRNTVTPDRAGEWKVELRAADGTVLQEERFVIR